MVAEELGEYYFIPYKFLEFLSSIDSKMKEIVKINSKFIKANDGLPPWLDFKIYRPNGISRHKMFIEILKRTIILNK